MSDFENRILRQTSETRRQIPPPERTIRRIEKEGCLLEIATRPITAEEKELRLLKYYAEPAPFVALESLRIHSTATGETIDLETLTGISDVTIFLSTRTDEGREYYSWPHDEIQHVTAPAMQEAESFISDLACLLHELGHIAQARDPRTSNVHELYDTDLLKKFHHRGDEIRGEQKTNQQLLAMVADVVRYYDGLEEPLQILETSTPALLKEDQLRSLDKAIRLQQASVQQERFIHFFQPVLGCVREQLLPHWNQIQRLMEALEQESNAEEADPEKIEKQFEPLFEQHGFQFDSRGLTISGMRALLSLISEGTAGAQGLKGGLLKCHSDGSTGRISWGSVSFEFELKSSEHDPQRAAALYAEPDPKLQALIHELKELRASYPSIPDEVDRAFHAILSWPVKAMERNATQWMHFWLRRLRTLLDVDFLQAESLPRRLLANKNYRPEAQRVFLNAVENMCGGLNAGYQASNNALQKAYNTIPRIRREPRDR